MVDNRYQRRFALLPIGGKELPPRIPKDNQMVTKNILTRSVYATVMWDLVSFAQSHARKTCLLILATGPKTPNIIASSACMNLSHVSRALKELSEKGLVECLTPKLTKNKIYQITPTGLEILNKIKLMNNNNDNKKIT